MANYDAAELQWQRNQWRGWQRLVMLGEQDPDEKVLADRLWSALGPLSREGMPRPSVSLDLCVGADEDRWSRMVAFLDLVAHNRSEPVLVGYFESGGSEVAKRVLSRRPVRVCLRPGTDWDWSVWVTTVEDAERVYRARNTWPEIVAPLRGGWLLETLPSANTSYLYPMPLVSTMLEDRSSSSPRK